MDIKISKAIEEDFMQESQNAAKEAVVENAKIESSEIANDIGSDLGKGLGLDGKTIGITAAVLVGLFLVASFGLDLFDGSGTTSAVVANVDDMHDQNVKGELDEDDAYRYNDFSFVKFDGLWWTELYKNSVDTGKVVEILKIPLHYGPRDLEDVSFSGVLDSTFDDGAEVYLTIDPEVRNQYYTLALSELNFNIVSGIGRLPIAACTEDVEECIGREIVSCDNNPENYPLIELVVEAQDLTGSLSFEGNCVKISGNEEMLVHAADRWLLHWYGIMPLEWLEVNEVSEE